MSANHDADLAAIEQPVGPFTGFGNFFFKEIRDWWNSLRLMIVTVLMTLIMLSLVFFALSNVLEHEQVGRNGEAAASKSVLGARVLVVLLSGRQSPGLILYIVIIIVTTMGLLTTEKSSGTLAWNLTKPLGRTGLFVAKWLAATLMLWIGTLVVPILAGTLAMAAYHGFLPDLAKITPLIMAAFAWIGLWVLLALTISLAFQSQGAVAGIMFAFWIVPNVLGALIGYMLDDEKAMEWALDRLATNSPFWAWDLFADKALDFRGKLPETKDVWVWAYVVWFVFLSAFSLRIFNRQEIGS